MNYFRKLRRKLPRNNTFVQQNFSWKNSGGFSIVEVLVSVFIFSIIMTSVGTIFTQLLMLQRRGSGAQKVQENVLYALELMAREIRVSSLVNQDTVGCSQTTLEMTHPVNGAVEYSLSEGSIQRRAGGGAASAITSKEVEFTRLNFCVDGTTVTGQVGDQEQARTTVVVQVRNRAGRVQDVVTFDLQTTVVSRDNTIEFTN